MTSVIMCGYLQAEDATITSMSGAPPRPLSFLLLIIIPFVTWYPLYPAHFATIYSLLSNLDHVSENYQRSRDFRCPVYLG